MKKTMIAALTLCIAFCTVFPSAVLAASTAESGLKQGMLWDADKRISMSASRPQDGVTQIEDGIMTYFFEISDSTRRSVLSLSFTGYITGDYNGPTVLDPGDTPFFRVSVEPGATMTLRTDESDSTDNYVFDIYSPVYPIGHSPLFSASEVFTFTQKGSYNIYLDTKQGDEICNISGSVFSRPPVEYLPETPSSLTSFADVPAGAWYEQEVAEAEAFTLAAKTRAQYDGKTIPQGLMGYDWSLIYRDYATMRGILKPNDFPYPDRPATREEMAYIFSRTMPEEEYRLAYKEDLPTAPDIEASPYRKEIELLYHCHIVSGSDARGSFRPESTITRAEAAAIINRLSRLTEYQDREKD